METLTCIFQSTFPRGERRGWDPGDRGRVPQFQSTFPRGERQTPPRSFDHFQRISIHVPTRGTTTEFFDDGEGEDTSIHVPTRGTTVFSFGPRLPRKDFNPRSHEGNDNCAKNFIGRERHFNPRSHEGNDRRCSKQETHWINFNPRSHEGNDDAALATSAFTGISIHVPTRGTTA